MVHTRVTKRSRPVSQSVSQLVSQPVSESASQSVRQSDMDRHTVGHVTLWKLLFLQPWMQDGYAWIFLEPKMQRSNAILSHSSTVQAHWFAGPLETLTAQRSWLFAPLSPQNGQGLQFWSIQPVHNQVGGAQDLSPHLISSSRIPNPQTLSFRHRVLLPLIFFLALFILSISPAVASRHSLLISL